MQPPAIHLSSSVQSLCDVIEPAVDSCSPYKVSPLISPASSVSFLADNNTKTFREFLLSALPMLVHPVIILRLLAHKLFGNMVKRKTLSSDCKLKPPKVLPMEICPPRDNLRENIGETNGDGNKESLPKRRKINLHVQITNSQEENNIANNSLKVCERDLARPNTLQIKNGTTKSALRVISESLVTPLDLNITASPCSLDSNHGTPDGDASKTSRKLFRWPSKKRLSKSNVNVSVTHRDSVCSQLSQVSSKPSSISSTPDIDIAAFQRELINLPTFVMDTAMSDISPVFSRSSSVPENLSCRVVSSSSVEETLYSITTDNFASDHGLCNKAILPSGQVLDSLCKSTSAVTITATNMGSGMINTDEDFPDTSLTNIVVRFEPPSSPLGSSSSQSPHTFCDLFTPRNSVANRDDKINLSNQMSTDNNSAVIEKFIGQSSNSPESDIIPSFMNINGNIQMSTPMRKLLNEIPYDHRGVLKVMNTWVSVCKTDLESGSLVIHEMRDFLNKLSVLGHDYKAWCHQISNLLQLEVSCFFKFLNIFLFVFFKSTMYAIH